MIASEGWNFEKHANVLDQLIQLFTFLITWLSIFFVYQIVTNLKKQTYFQLTLQTS